MGTWHGSSGGTGSTHYVAGRVGSYAGMFDGTTNWMDTNNTYGQLSTGDITVSFWMNSTGTQSGTHIISNRGTNPSIFFIGGASGSVVNAYAYDSVPHTAVTNSIVAFDGTWHFIAATYARAGNLSVYNDGILHGTTTLSNIVGSLTSAYPFSIGSRASGGGSDYTGLLDDIRFYNRALSAADARRCIMRRNDGYDIVRKI